MSEVRGDKPKDVGKGGQEHADRFGKPEPEDKRQRSNSPISSPYKSNNLGQKDAETSLNLSGISNKMNTSTVKAQNERPPASNPAEKKSTALTNSKSYENLPKAAAVQNSILNANSRENSIDKALQKGNDRSKSPETQRKGIFDAFERKEEKKAEPKSPLNQAAAKGEQEKKSFKGPGNEKPQDKSSYRAAKISEIDDSILKEIEKAKELEEKLEKVMKTNKELYSQMPPFKSPTEQKKLEVAETFSVFLKFFIAPREEG